MLAIIQTIISTPAYGGFLVMLVELAMRLWPTANAWSLLVPIQLGCNGIAALLTWFSNTVLSALIQNMNNLKPPAPAPAPAVVPPAST